MTDRMPGGDPERIDADLNAYLDHELAATERAAIEQRLAAEPELAQRLEALRTLDSELRDSYAHSPAEAEAAIARVSLPRPGRKTWFVVPAAVAAGVLIGLALQTPLTTPVAPVATTLLGVVSVATGELTLRTGEREEPARSGSLLPERAIVSADANTRGSIQLTDGSLLRLDRGASVRLTANRVIEVIHGRVWSRISPGDPFRVLAGETSITVLGTELALRRTDSRTHLQLFSGRARVEAAGATRELAAGQEVAFEKGRLAPTRRIHSVAIATGWMLELHAFAGGRDDALANHMDRLLTDLGRTKMISIDEQTVIAELHDVCRVPVARYLVSEGARTETPMRQKAARVLAEIADRSVMPALLKALEDEDSAVRISTAEAIRMVSKAAACADPKLFRYRNKESRSATQAAQAWWANETGERRR